jgi:FtsP/CotA-like multicopper oxidase with cupredoxin domain
MVISCGAPAPGDGPSATTEQRVGSSADEVPLDPTTVPKFAHQLPIPELWTGTNVTHNGRVTQVNYRLSVVEATQQMLPPGFPATTVLAYSGLAHPKGSSTSSNVTVTPGAVFENTVGTPSQVTFIDNIQQPQFLQVDPTLHWADPLAEQVPTPPFHLFPPGYPNSLFPVAHVTHTHGLAVAPTMDGTAEEWFTPNLTYKGPSFVTNVYLQPNQQAPTQLFYHDHVMGVTRIGLYSGIIGTADFIRDPAHNLLDGPLSPLPRDGFEIPLALTARRFYTDGNVDFPPDRGTLNSANAGDQNGGDSPPNQPYWSYNEGADEILVNGAVWPNLNVKRQQYRFRLLAGANAQLFDLKLCVGDWNAHQTDAGTNTLVTISDDGNSAKCNTRLVPLTIIGSDGGYLPAPLKATDVQIGITERADVLVDFSQFAPGTKILMMNSTALAGHGNGTTEVVMQFTVQNSLPIPALPLPSVLFPSKPTLTANAPKRTKVLWSFVDDDPLASTFDKRAIDGLDFDTPATEFALVGSTEEWDLVNTFPGGPGSEFAGDSDLNTHQIHIHLLEFQVMNRQAFDCAHYSERWTLLNGHNPVSSTITLDPTPYLQGSTVAPAPVETGWKDTIEAPTCMITRILVRWAPQATSSGGVQPGQNQFPFDPTSFPDPVAGPGYVWHCHLVGHEDHDMMRELVIVNSWAPNVSYKVGTVVAFDNADFRVTTAHTSLAGQTPDMRFDLWDRVNNEASTGGGQWTPQVRYAVNDRVLYQGKLYSALSVFQSQANQTPPSNPTLWAPLPNDACGQLTAFCQDNSLPFAQQCLAAGQAGNQTTCLGALGSGPRGTPNVGMSECLSDCVPALPTPCAGLCNNPTAFSVAANGTFQSGNLGTGAACFETQSRLTMGESSSFVAPRQLTVNGRPEPLDGNWNSPLPPLRHNGYCIQTTPGSNSFAAFSVSAGPN